MLCDLAFCRRAYIVNNLCDVKNGHLLRFISRTDRLEYLFDFTLCMYAINMSYTYSIVFTTLNISIMFTTLFTRYAYSLTFVPCIAYNIREAFNF